MVTLEIMLDGYGFSLALIYMVNLLVWTSKALGVQTQNLKSNKISWLVVYFVVRVFFFLWWFFSFLSYYFSGFF